MPFWGMYGLLPVACRSRRTTRNTKRGALRLAELCTLTHQTLMHTQRNGDDDPVYVPHSWNEKGASSCSGKNTRRNDEEERIQ